MKSALEILSDRWYEKAKTRAWQDPTWAEIEQRRHIEGSSNTKFLTDELSWEDWETQSDIWQRINPAPWHQRLQWWLKRNGFRAKKSALRIRWQRSKKGYSYFDLWGFDHYHAKVMVNALGELKENLHGHPGELEFEQWKEIIEEIRDGFRAAGDIIDLNFDVADKEARKALEAKFESGMDLLKKWYFGLWD